MRLNTPIGSSLQYTDAKMRDVEAAFAQDRGCRMRSSPTSAPDEGRNYARIMLRLTDRRITSVRRSRISRRQMRERIGAHGRHAACRSAAATTSRSSSPSLARTRTSSPSCPQQLHGQAGEDPGHRRSGEQREGRAIPTIAVRINNELASDLGLTTRSHRQCPATARSPATRSALARARTARTTT